MKEWLREHLWNTLPEHVIWILGAGVVLLLSGATPEEWISRGVDQLPRSVIPTISTDTLVFSVRLILVFLGVLFIGGALILKRKRSSAVNTSAPQETTRASSTPVVLTEPPPLPTNAKFRYRGKVFWAAPRRYTKDEAEEMRRALREVYDCINAKSAPLVANYDGSAVMFTRNWISIIQEQGPRSAIAQLDGIRSKVLAAHAELQNILGRRPSYRQDIETIIGDRGDVGNMNGALNHYIDALKVLPEQTTADLIKLAISPVEDSFVKAIAGYTEWVGAFNTKMMLLREELEALSA